MAHGQAQCPVGLKSGYTGMEGWSCQRVSLYKDSYSCHQFIRAHSYIPKVDEVDGGIYVVESVYVVSDGTG